MEAASNIVGIISQDIAGLNYDGRYQGQAFQADHDVAAPIGKPMVSRDDGSRFVSRGPRGRESAAQADGRE